MHVAVCIVSFRSAEDIQACLRALAASDHRDFEVVICENGGPEAFTRLEATTPSQLAGGQRVVRLLAAGNLGYAGGVNACLRAAPGADAWWVLNPDTAPEPGALSALLRRLSAGDRHLVGGTVYSPSGRVESRAGRWRPWLARAVALGQGGGLDEPVDAARIEAAASYISGSCMLLGRRFLSVAGEMREDYFLYCEEVEWCLRGLRRGLRIGYAPEARVLHLKGTATGSVADLRHRPRMPVYLDERNKLLLTRDLFPARFPIAALAALVLLALRFGKRGAWRQLGYALQGWLAGLMNRRGAPAWML